jgi:hypothetical protein
VVSSFENPTSREWDSAGSNPITRFSFGRKGRFVVAVYVDDLLIAGHQTLEAIKKVKEELAPDVRDGRPGRECSTFLKHPSHA